MAKFGNCLIRMLEKDKVDLKATKDFDKFSKCICSLFVECTKYFEIF